MDLQVKRVVKRKIYAVHDEDLEAFLTDLNLLDKIKEGKIKCPECNCTLTLENIGFFLVSKGEIKICCDDLNCLYGLKRTPPRVEGGEEN